MNVHAWCQQNVAAILKHFVTDALTHFLNELGVPSAGECSAYRESCTEIGVGVVVTSGIDSDSGRTISEDGRRDAETWNRLCHTCCSWHTLSVTTNHAIVR